MKIVFDLDGTLICSKKRLHELFCDLTESRKLDFSAYWEMKFSRKTNQDILKLFFNYSDEKIDNFTNDWMSKIESDYYLNFDDLIVDIEPFLKKAKKNSELYVCTARQSSKQVEKQLKRLGVFEYFEDVFVTEKNFTKENLLINSSLNLCKDDWMIGDTGHDIMTGKKVGMNTCAVLSGFMSRSALLSYEPDLILSDVTKFDISLILDEK